MSSRKLLRGEHVHYFLCAIEVSRAVAQMPVGTIIQSNDQCASQHSTMAPTEHSCLALELQSWPFWIVSHGVTLGNVQAHLADHLGLKMFNFLKVKKCLCEACWGPDAHYYLQGRLQIC